MRFLINIKNFLSDYFLTHYRLKIYKTIKDIKKGN